MSEKVFLLGLILGFAFYSIGTNYLLLLSAKRPVPNNLSDLWPAEESEKKQKGNTVSCAFLFRSTVVICSILTGLVAFDIPAFLFSMLPYHPLIRSLGAVIFMTLCLLGLGWVVRHLMMINEKYGVVKMTWRKTRRWYFIFSIFILVAIFLTVYIEMTAPQPQGSTPEYSPIIPRLLISLFAVVGCFSAIGFILYRKTRNLPEGDLSNRIRELVRKSGVKHCTVRMMPIRNPNKLNGCCLFLPGRKKIILFFNPEVSQDEDQIMAIAAHDLGHCVHGTMTEIVIPLILTLFPAFLSAGLADRYGVWIPGMRAGFLFFIYVYFPALFSAVCACRRKREYEADSYAAQAGFAEPLIKLFRRYVYPGDELLNPHPLLVRIICTHPPISQRITAIYNEETDNEGPADFNQRFNDKGR